MADRGCDIREHDQDGPRSPLRTARAICRPSSGRSLATGSVSRRGRRRARAQDFGWHWSSRTTAPVQRSCPARTPHLRPSPAATAPRRIWRPRKIYLSIRDSDEQPGAGRGARFSANPDIPRGGDPRMSPAPKGCLSTEPHEGRERSRRTATTAISPAAIAAGACATARAGWLGSSVPWSPGRSPRPRRRSG